MQVRRVAHRELDAPGQIGRAAIATAVHQATPAAKKRSQRHAGRQDVGQFPERKTLSPGEHRASGRSADQAPVVNDPAVLHHEDFQPRRVAVLTGRLGNVRPIRNHIDGARARHRPDQQPGAAIEDCFRVSFCRKARRLAFHRPNKKPDATKMPYQVMVSGPNLKAMSCTADKIESPRAKSKGGLGGHGRPTAPAPPGLTLLIHRRTLFSHAAIYPGLRRSWTAAPIVEAPFAEVSFFILHLFAGAEPEVLAD